MPTWRVEFSDVDRDDFINVTLVCHFKKVMHRRWSYFKTRVGFTMALFNILVQWDGLSIEDDGFVPLSIAQFSL